MTKTPVFTGSGVAICTPFTENGIHFDRLTQWIEFHIKSKTDSIIICGTTGEASTMSDEEHQHAISHAVKVANGRIPIVAGTGSNDTLYAAEMSKYAEDAGADACLVVTPYYNKATQKGLLKHFETIAAATSIPIILYNVPSRTGMTIAIDTYKELAKIPHINGTKEASGDISHIAKLFAACGDSLNVWSGNDDQILPILALGGKGVISVAANIVPEIVHNICTLWFEGKVQECVALQREYLELFNDLFIEVNPAPIKNAMNLMGFDAGELRMPMVDLDPKNLEIVKKSLQNKGLLKI